MVVIKRMPTCTFVMLKLLELGRNPVIDMNILRGELLRRYPDFDWYVQERVVRYTGELQDEIAIDNLFCRFIEDYYVGMENLIHRPALSSSMVQSVVQENVRRIRRQRGYTQMEASTMLEQRYTSFVRKIENGEICVENITVGRIANLAHVLRVDIEDLLVPTERKWSNP